MQPHDRSEGGRPYMTAPPRPAPIQCTVTRTKDPARRRRLDALIAELVAREEAQQKLEAAD